MILRKETRTCKKHGTTIFGVYQYGKSTSYRCLECVREAKALRRSNNEKNEHDKMYTRGWAKNNKDRLVELRINHAKKALQKRKHQVDIILSENKTMIKYLIKKIECSLTILDIHAYCLRKVKTPTFDDIKAYIIANKKSELLRKVCWEQSYLAKYHYGVINTIKYENTYKDLPEDEKIIIRREYKKNTYQIVNKKIEELCAMI